MAAACLCRAKKLEQLRAPHDLTEEGIIRHHHGLGMCIRTAARSLASPSAVSGKSGNRPQKCCQIVGKLCTSSIACNFRNETKTFGFRPMKSQQQYGGEVMRVQVAVGKVRHGETSNTARASSCPYSSLHDEPPKLAGPMLLGSQRKMAQK